MSDDEKAEKAEKTESGVVSPANPYGLTLLDIAWLHVPAHERYMTKNTVNRWRRMKRSQTHGKPRNHRDWFIDSEREQFIRVLGKLVYDGFLEQELRGKERHLYYRPTLWRSWDEFETLVMRMKTIDHLKAGDAIEVDDL